MFHSTSKYITTKRILSFATKSQFILTDATCKLMWQGFPLFICRTIDRSKAFHPTRFQLCRNETEIDFRFMFGTVKTQLDSIQILSYTFTRICCLFLNKLVYISHLYSIKTHYLLDSCQS